MTINSQKPQKLRAAILKEYEDIVVDAVVDYIETQGFHSGKDGFKLLIFLIAPTSPLLNGLQITLEYNHIISDIDLRRMIRDVKRNIQAYLTENH